jgi:Flp pilus assembly protein TadG
MATRLKRPPLSGEQGNSLVEFALVLPLLLLVFAGIVDFGFLFQRYEVVTNAAREGARLAVLPGYTATDVENRVRAYVREGLGGVAADIDSRTTVALASVPVAPGVGAAFTGAQVTVTFTYDYLLLGVMINLATGGDFGRAITVHAVSTMRPEVSS